MPEPGPGQVLLKVGGAGACRSELGVGSAQDTALNLDRWSAISPSDQLTQPSENG